MQTSFKCNLVCWNHIWRLRGRFGCTPSEQFIFYVVPHAILYEDSGRAIFIESAFSPFSVNICVSNYLNRRYSKLASNYSVIRYSIRIWSSTICLHTPNNNLTIPSWLQSHHGAHLDWLLKNWWTKQDGSFSACLVIAPPLYFVKFGQLSCMGFHFSSMRVGGLKKKWHFDEIPAVAEEIMSTEEFVACPYDITVCKAICVS